MRVGRGRCSARVPREGGCRRVAQTRRQRSLWRGHAPRALAASAAHWTEHRPCGSRIRQAQPLLTFPPFHLGGRAPPPPCAPAERRGRVPPRRPRRGRRVTAATNRGGKPPQPAGRSGGIPTAAPPFLPPARAVCRLPCRLALAHAAAVALSPPHPFPLLLAGRNTIPVPAVASDWCVGVGAVPPQTEGAWWSRRWAGHHRDGHLRVPGNENGIGRRRFVAMPASASARRAQR